MKKLLLIFATLSVVLFVSCEEDNEKEITSLEGTVWKEYSEPDNGGWSKCELIFTESHAIYVSSNSVENNVSFTGSYTFDPPNVLITSSCLTLTGSNMGTIVWDDFQYHQGTIDGRTMEIGIKTPGQTMFVFLKKQ